MRAGGRGAGTMNDHERERLARRWLAEGRPGPLPLASHRGGTRLQPQRPMQHLQPRPLHVPPQASSPEAPRVPKR